MSVFATTSSQPCAHANRSGHIWVIDLPSDTRVDARFEGMWIMGPFVDLLPTPTVHVYLMVPVALIGGGWTWGELQRFGGVLASEYVYSATECESVARTYGATMTRMIKTYEADRFCILVRGRVTGHLIGRQEWEYVPGMRTYQPVGEYHCGFRGGVRALWEATGRVVTSEAFKARTELSMAPQWVTTTPPMSSAA